MSTLENSESVESNEPVPDSDVVSLPPQSEVIPELTWERWQEFAELWKIDPASRSGRR